MIAVWLLQAPTTQEPQSVEVIVREVQNPWYHDLILLILSAGIAAAIGAWLAGRYSLRAAQQAIAAATNRELAERTWDRSGAFGAVLTELRMNRNLMSENRYVQEAFLLFETSALEATYPHLATIGDNYRDPLQEVHALIRRYNTLALYSNNKQQGHRYATDLESMADAAVTAIEAAEETTLEAAVTHQIAAERLDELIKNPLPAG